MSAPENFQRQMSTLLKDHEGVVVVMDEILVYGATTNGSIHQVRNSVLWTAHQCRLPEAGPQQGEGSLQIGQVLGLINYVGRFLPDLVVENDRVLSIQLN